MKTLLALTLAFATALASDTGGRIQQQLLADPVTRNLSVRADQYDDLVILHGWVLNPQIKNRVVAKVMQMDGVAHVYSYIVTDPPQDLGRIMNMGKRVELDHQNRFG